MTLNRTILKSAKKHYALKRDPLSGARWDLVRDLRAVANELSNARMSDSGSSNYHTTQLGTAKKWNAARNSLMSLLRSANPYLTTDNLKTLASRIANKIGKLNLLIAKDVSVDEWNLAIIELVQIIRSLETALPYAEEIKRVYLKRASKIDYRGRGGDPDPYLKQKIALTQAFESLLDHDTIRRLLERGNVKEAFLEAKQQKIAFQSALNNQWVKWGMNRIAPSKRQSVRVLIQTLSEKIDVLMQAVRKNKTESIRDIQGSIYNLTNVLINVLAP